MQSLRASGHALRPLQLLQLLLTLRFLCAAFQVVGRGERQVEAAAAEMVVAAARPHLLSSLVRHCLQACQRQHRSSRFSASRLLLQSK
jgi:hypothetical protein